MIQRRHRFLLLGCWVSEKTANFFAHPAAQIGVILFCIAWFALDFRVDILTAALSILAITLTQMVLNRQEERERDAHRRDMALHAKLDELVLASKRARDEIAGIEELEEDQIQALREAGIGGPSARPVYAPAPSQSRMPARLPRSWPSTRRRTSS